MSEQMGQITRDTHRERSVYADRCLWLFGQVDGGASWPYITSALVADALREHGSRPVTVFLNSNGGSVAEAVATFDALSAHPHPVTVVVDRRGEGAAVLIALAGAELHVRRDAHLDFGCYCACCGSTSPDRSRYAELVEGRLAMRLSRSAEDVRTFLGRQWRFSVAEAVEAGIAASSYAPMSVLLERLREALETPQPHRRIEQ